jgi:hypothetical protein
MKKITLQRIAIHEFQRALRVWRRLYQPTEIIRSLFREKLRAQNGAIRLFLLALVGSLWLAANKPELPLKISLIDISMPASYVSFVISFLCFLTAAHVISYFFLVEFARIACNRLFRFDNSSAFELIEDASGSWSMPVSIQYRYFTSPKAHETLQQIVAWLLGLPFLLVAIFIYATSIRFGIVAIARDGFLSVAFLLTFVGWLLMIFPFAYLYFLRREYSFSKNAGFIRWLVLYPIYKRGGSIPAHVRGWHK